ncbi:MAG: Sec-independent protein translocase protein TatB [Burkholderiales bacterium]
MFDIGFTELMVIGVVALVVIGPERLPGVARTIGHLAGRLQRYVNDVKADISREMEFDELRKMRDSMQEAATEVENTVRKELSDTEQDLNKTVAEAVEDKASAPEAIAAPEPAAPPVEPAEPAKPQ